jgi:hypothetical protein
MQRRAPATIAQVDLGASFNAPTHLFESSSFGRQMEASFSIIVGGVYVDAALEQHCEHRSQVGIGHHGRLPNHPVQRSPALTIAQITDDNETIFQQLQRHRARCGGLANNSFVERRPGLDQSTNMRRMKIDSIRQYRFYASAPRTSSV